MTTEDELRALLETVGNAVVDGLRARGLTAVVVRYDEEEGQVHATAFFKEVPQDVKEHDAVWGILCDLSIRFFDEALVYFHMDEADECEDAGYADHVLTLAAA